MEYQRAQLKQSVKQVMRQTRPRPIWMTLLYLVISAVGTGVIRQILSGLNWSSTIMSYYLTMLINGTDPDMAVDALLRWIFGNGIQMILAIALGSLVVALVLYLWQSLMTVGYEGYCLAMSRGQNPGVSTLFCAFPRAGGVLLTRLLTGVFMFLWSLLFTLGLVVVMILGAGLATAVPFLGALVMFAGMIAYIVVLVWVSLRYALADYILLDQGVSGMQAVRRSKEMMRGNTGKLFVLQLSFIGWYLVMFAVFFVGLLILVLVLGGVLGAALSASGQVADLFAVLGIFWVIVLILLLVQLAISLWLQPYLTGSVARFYDFLLGRQPQKQGGWTAPGGGGQDPWDRNGPERRDAWDQSSYTWTAGQPGQSRETLNPPAGGTEERKDGEGDGQDRPSGPSYPKY